MPSGSPTCEDFFLGPQGLESQVRAGEGEIDPREASTIQLQDLPARVRIGKFGPFVEVEDGGKTGDRHHPGGGGAGGPLDEEQVSRLVRAKTEGPDSLGTDPETGLPIFLLEGRFGPYVQLGEAREEGTSRGARRCPRG
jgi:DNA topoisomerase I